MDSYDFIRNLAIGTTLTLVNLMILLLAAKPSLHYLKKRLAKFDHQSSKHPFVVPLTVVMSFLFLGHLLQFATWAAVFLAIGQFDSYETAFYFSATNFTSLGYGDIIMDPTWRLLGPLEAANGVLMFGLSAGLLVAVIGYFFRSTTQAEHQKPVE
jgi:hypothetical protein